MVTDMWQEGAGLSLDELVAFVTASGPGTLPVSGVGGPPDKRLRVCVYVCVRVCVCARVTSVWAETAPERTPT